jgi:hypothetical protein
LNLVIAVEVEAKAKELAVLKLIEEIKKSRKISLVEFTKPAKSI